MFKPRIPLRALLGALVLASIGIGVPLRPAAAHAEGCPNEQLRRLEAYASQLPDCRAYEQVSPTDKNLTDAIGSIGLTQSSPSGEKVTFVSLAPFPGGLGSSAPPTYLASRAADGSGWSTRGLLPETEAGEIAQVMALTEDLSEALVSVGSSIDLYDTATVSKLAVLPGVEVFSGATADDSQILFESRSNLYDWEGGQERLVGLLPGGGAPAEGAGAGPGGQFQIGPPDRKGRSAFYTQNAISLDGSRISFTDLETQHVYMRVRKSQSEHTIEVSPGPAEWRAATPDGSKVFYTEDGGLYRFNVEGENINGETLTSRTELANTEAGAMGMLGISENGSYAYFVATGKLASGATKGEANLYVWHEGGGVTFIATMDAEHDYSDWRGFSVLSPAESAGGQKSSRVTPNGETLLFSSTEPLTGYDNSGEHELYLYRASTATLACISCNPRGSATTGANLVENVLGYHSLPTARNSFLTRNLSDDGSRVFFQTEEALVPQDTNNQSDVYEWDAGHLYLISTGQGDSPSYFGDASASGDDVFFFTDQRLVTQDQDNNYDLYDARVDGGIAGQNPTPQLSCQGEEECHGATAPPPAFGAPSSSTFSGAGNVAPQPVEAGSAKKPKSKSATRTQKLAKALRICRRKPKRLRAECETLARKRYAGKAKARKTGRRGR